jgi:acetyltransferase-like isoleucine patch superfamily enzyme
MCREAFLLATDALSPLARLYANVELGDGVRVGDFVVLGHPPAGRAEGELALRIGELSVIRSHAVIYAGTTIGQAFQTGHGALIREECVIGDDCSVGSGSVVEFRVRLGNSVRLHSRVFVPEYSVLEDGCWLGPNVVVTNARFPAARRTKQTLEGVLIRRAAKIGANSTLLPGVEIGEGALIGAGSVVTRRVPPWALAYGNPARIAGDVRELKYEDGGEAIYPPRSSEPG